MNVAIIFNKQRRNPMSNQLATREHQPIVADPIHRGRYYQPNVDILEDDNGFRIIADIPGVKPGEVTINYQNGALTINGKVAPRQTEKTRFLMREYGVADYHRHFDVGESVDVDRIAADYSDGVLTVTLPKAESAKPRKITVENK
jgi:HSP20 family protein